MRELLEANFMGRAMDDSALSNEVISTKLMVLGSCKGKTMYIVSIQRVSGVLGHCNYVMWLLSLMVRDRTFSSHEVFDS